MRDKPILTTAQVQAANEAHIASLTGVALTAVRLGRFEFPDPPDRLAMRGIPCIGSGGIDDRQDPLYVVLGDESRRQA